MKIETRSEYRRPGPGTDLESSPRIRAVAAREANCRRHTPSGFPLVGVETFHAWEMRRRAIAGPPQTALPGNIIQGSVDMVSNLGYPRVPADVFLKPDSAAR